MKVLIEFGVGETSAEEAEALVEMAKTLKRVIDLQKAKAASEKWRMEQGKAAGLRQ
jgi:hypothetical protein